MFSRWLLLSMILLSHALFAQTDVHIDSLLKTKGTLSFNIETYELEGTEKKMTPVVKSSIMLKRDTIVFFGTGLFGDQVKRKAYAYSGFKRFEKKSEDGDTDVFYKAHYRHSDDGGSYEMFVRINSENKQSVFLLWHTVAATEFQAVMTTK